MLSLGQDLSTPCTEERGGSDGQTRGTSCPTQGPGVLDFGFVVTDCRGFLFCHKLCITSSVDSFIFIFYFLTALFIVELLYVTEGHLAHVGFFFNYF